MHKHEFKFISVNFRDVYHLKENNEKKKLSQLIQNAPCKVGISDESKYLFFGLLYN